MDTRMNQIQAVMNDAAFVERIVSIEDPVEVQKAFAEKGISFSLEEINMIAEMVINGSNGEEMTEAELEGVSGGVLAEIAIVASGVALFANCMTEYNKSRKSKGKRTIW